MALEDVVQGVQVTVKTDGVDDATDKIGKLDKAVGDLAKTAEGASGSRSGSGGGAGIGGLNKAFGDLNIVSAQAFANIARSAVSGDLTGLATMMGGPVAGSVVEAAKALSQFIDTQDAAILKNAAMAKEMGTTPGVIQGLREGFEGAGVSAMGFERLVNRMSRQVQTDYTEMTRNIRTDSDTQEGAILRVQAAQEKLAIAKGADPAQYAYQDKLREQKQAQIALDQAEEGVRQQALKSIPHVTDLLKEAMETGRTNNELTEVSSKTLRQSIEHLAQTGSGPADPINVLKTEFDLIKGGAIGADKAVELLKEQMGSMRAAGLGGMDAQHLFDYAKEHGATGIEAAQSGASLVKKLGLGQSAQDTESATKNIESWSKLTGVLGAVFQKIGSAATPATTTAVEGFTHTIEEMVQQVQEASKLRAALHPPAESNWGIADAFHKYGDEFNKLNDEAGNFYRNMLQKIPGIGKWFKPGTITLPEDKKETPPGGTPVPGSGGLTEEYVGGDRVRGAHIFHVPQGYGGPAPGESSVGTGPAKIITPPANYGEEDTTRRHWTPPTGQPPAYITPPSPTDIRYQHMSVVDDANAPWRSLRDGGGGAAPSIPDVGPKIEAAGGGVVSALNSIGAAIAAAGAGLPSYQPSTGAPPSKWRGGAIRIPGYASGGRVRVTGGSIPGFADGGPTSFSNLGPMAGLMADGIAVGSDIWEQVKAMAPNSAEEARTMAMDFIRGHITGSAMEKAAVSGLEAAGVYGSKAVVGTAVGVLSNPFGTGLLDANTTAAADYGAGAKQEEEKARARGAHNLKEAAELGMWSGGIPGFANGTIRGPGTGTSDSILARVSNGEFVMRDAAVRTYGEGFMHAINNMQIPPPKYAYGGMIPTSSLPHFAESGAMERPGSILNLHVGGEVFSGLRAPAAVADQLRKFAINQQTAQTGKKPSWAGG